MTQLNGMAAIVILFYLHSLSPIGMGSLKERGHALNYLDPFWCVFVAQKRVRMNHFQMVM